MFSFTVADAHGVLRKFRRGGMMRHFLHDRYLFDNRPLKEFSLTAELHADGLPVPQPLGVCWRQRYGWYEGWIATRELDAPDLATCIDENGGSLGDILIRVGMTLRDIHDAGVYHADLNTRNILASGTDVYLIDFDRGRRFSVLSRTRRSRNLLRLRRSLRKMGAESEYASIASGYGPIQIPVWMRFCYLIRCLTSNRLQTHSCRNNRHA